MRKDIILPEMQGIEMAIVHEFNETFLANEWNFYLLNKSNQDLEVVMIVSQGFSTTQNTTLMRKKIDTLPAQSFARVEYIPDDVLSLNNKFQISFFIGSTLYEKTFLFPSNIADEDTISPIDFLDKKGIVIGES